MAYKYSGGYGGKTNPADFVPYVPGDFPLKVNGKIKEDILFFNIFRMQIPLNKEHIMANYLISALRLKEKNIEYETDVKGNLFVWVGTKQADGSLLESKTIFSCHMDTVQKDQFPKEPKKIAPSILVRPATEKEGEKGFMWAKIKKQDTKTKEFVYQDCVLGGDDKCGIYVMARFIRNRIPGLYLFHVGEEAHCIGSRHIASTREQLLSKYSRAIAFDRRDYEDVITHQTGDRCCSDDFAKDLSSQLNLNMPPKINYKPCDGGAYTDTASYMGVIPECTNLSIGYFQNHGTQEYIDTVFLREIFVPAALKVDWEKLPTVRDPKIKESKYKTYSGGYDDGDFYGYGTGTWRWQNGKWVKSDAGGLDSDPNSNVGAEQKANATALETLIKSPFQPGPVKAWMYKNPDLAAQLIYYAISNPLLKTFLGLDNKEIINLPAKTKEEKPKEDGLVEQVSVLREEVITSFAFRCVSISSAAIKLLDKVIKDTDPESAEFKDSVDTFTKVSTKLAKPNLSKLETLHIVVSLVQLLYFSFYELVSTCVISDPIMDSEAAAVVSDIETITYNIPAEKDDTIKVSEIIKKLKAVQDMMSHAV